MKVGDKYKRIADGLVVEITKVNYTVGCHRVYFIWLSGINRSKEFFSPSNRYFLAKFRPVEDVKEEPEEVPEYGDISGYIFKDGVQMTTEEILTELRSKV